MNKSSSSHFALVLPGAVARGAYEAGVIEVLADRKIKIDRIVATSSGALNGLAYAVGIRSGREQEMAKKLTTSWIENGGWHSSFDISPWGLLRGRGLSNQNGLLKMMRELIKPCKNSVQRDVELRIIVTPLNGVISKIGKKTATTYEQIVEFSGEQFDTAEGLEEAFNVVGAACAFPGLFKPVEIPKLGFCVDGGTVNNAPIKYALQQSDVNRIIMAVPFPEIMNPGDWKSGFGLLNHLIEILINERLFRDLKNTQNINLHFDRLTSMRTANLISDEQFDLIKDALKIRHVEITEVRPDQNLKSGAFSGFFHKKDRVRLIDQGRKATHEALDLQLNL